MRKSTGAAISVLMRVSWSFEKSLVDKHNKILDHPLNLQTEAKYSIRVSINTSLIILDTKKSTGTAISVLVRVSWSFEKSLVDKKGCFLHFAKIGYPNVDYHCG